MKPLTAKEKHLLDTLLSKFLTEEQGYSFGKFLLEQPEAGLNFAVRVRKSLPEKVQHLFYKDKYDSRLNHCLVELT